MFAIPPELFAQIAQAVGGAGAAGAGPGGMMQAAMGGGMGGGAPNIPPPQAPQMEPPQMPQAHAGMDPNAWGTTIKKPDSPFVSPARMNMSDIGSAAGQNIRSPEFRETLSKGVGGHMQDLMKAPQGGGQKPPQAPGMPPQAEGTNMQNTGQAIQGMMGKPVGPPPGPFQKTGGGPDEEQRRRMGFAGRLFGGR